MNFVVVKQQLKSVPFFAHSRTYNEWSHRKILQNNGLYLGRQRAPASLFFHFPIFWEITKERRATHSITLFPLNAMFSWGCDAAQVVVQDGTQIEMAIPLNCLAQQRSSASRILVASNQLAIWIQFSYQPIRRNGAEDQLHMKGKWVSEWLCFLKGGLITFAGRRESKALTNGRGPASCNIENGALRFTPRPTR